MSEGRVIEVGARKNAKTAGEIEAMRKSGAITSACLKKLARMCKPGVTGLDLDATAKKLIESKGGRAAFKGYMKYPSHICVGVNDGVIHGIPDDYEFEDGDIVSIDVGTELDGWYTDACVTVPVGEVNEQVAALLAVTRGALQRGLIVAIPGVKTGMVAKTIQEYVESQGMNIVVGYDGHGIGRGLHEQPEVPNVGKGNEGKVLIEGLTICIEPLVTLGSGEAYLGDDSWSVYTADYMPAAHFEQTVVVTRDGVDILTPHDFLD